MSRDEIDRIELARYRIRQYARDIVVETAHLPPQEQETVARLKAECEKVAAMFDAVLPQ